MRYKIRISKESEAALRDFPGDFEEALYQVLPSVISPPAEFLGSPDIDPDRLVLKLELEGEDWAIVAWRDKKKNLLKVKYVYQAKRLPSLSREEALASVQAAIGQHRWPISGPEYVRGIKREWRGLLPRDRRHS